jgi:hypothetical protein
MNVVSFIALAVTLAIIVHELAWTFTKQQTLTLTALVLGWEPVITTIRSAQSGLLLAAFLVMGWMALRRARPWAAGAFVAVATSLKLFPAVVAAYLLVRRPRAFVSCAVVFTLFLALTIVLCGPGVIREFRDTSHGVLDRYASYPPNLSGTSLVLRSLPLSQRPVLSQPVILSVVALGLIGLAALGRSSTNKRAPETEQIDSGYAMSMTLALVISPIAWDHYQVVLLLPFSLLGTWLSRRSRAPQVMEVLGFIGVVWVTCIPEQLFFEVAHSVRDSTHSPILEYLVTVPRTLALLAVAAWFVRTRPRPVFESVVPVPSA